MLGVKTHEHCGYFTTALLMGKLCTLCVRTQSQSRTNGCELLALCSPESRNGVHWAWMSRGWLGSSSSHPSSTAERPWWCHRDSLGKGGQNLSVAEGKCVRNSPESLRGEREEGEQVLQVSPRESPTGAAVSLQPVQRTLWIRYLEDPTLELVDVS